MAGATILLCGSSLQAANVSAESCPTNTPPVGLIFSFQADALGGTSLFPHSPSGALGCMFNNLSGQNFTSLMITTPLPPNSSLGAFTCGGDLFSPCSVSLDPAGNNLIFNFLLRPNSDGFTRPGVPKGTEFALDLGTSGFVPGQTYQVAANGATIPEPVSAALVLAGVAAILVRKARKKTT